MRRGLVVGKFAPLHLGHQYLLETAAAHCDELHVWVYSNPEPARMPAPVRAGWITTIYAQTYGPAIGTTPLRVRYLLPEADELPSNAAPDYVHREFVRRQLAALGVRIDVVFSSEAYGPGFAAHLGAAHVLVDASRARVPVSGTQVRTDVYGQANWLHPVVQAHFASPAYVQRVVLLGAESTGKSTLAAALARRFGSCHVAEYGRTLWEAQHGHLAYDDLLRIARRHRALEDEATPQARHWLFVDTNALTTLFYSYAYYGRAEPELHALAHECSTRYQHSFVCAPDFPFEQDGTRAPAAAQAAQQAAVLLQLGLLGISYTVLTGSVEARLQQVAEVLGCYNQIEL
ncbi:cytidyltransferase-like domain-containing protein [Hymenobacter oligotrophus]|uniref:Cytidyltransferase-like domain-containing protein n=1 Tax=Hymenobacter oligotrophus TaxID=2319843 RepID=A0A3B7QYC2_9BACT|nr:AAA family ATPase [Hymenobacter oligotrophus]AYA36595.1 cytidyltransferase-like domain-containing protein [Hymenobacter oligotrophus]